MLKNIISNIIGDDEPAAQKASRVHPRRSGDKCVAVVDGKMYPIENWSEGGVLLAADDRMFAVDQDCDLVLKFKLRDDIIEIPHKGSIVRKGDQKIALRFAETDKATHDIFQTIVDDFVTQRFIESQESF